MLSLLIAVGLLGGLMGVLVFLTIAEGPSLRRDLQRLRAWARDLFRDEPIEVRQTDRRVVDGIARFDRARHEALLREHFQPVSPDLSRQVHADFARIRNLKPIRAVGKSERTIKIEVS